jgi:GDP-L-fucose synthase
MTMNEYWKNKRVCVTGGAGFLGSFVCAKSAERGVADIFIPTIEEYDLVQKSSINKMLDDSKPDIIIHLAAQVGGIGANMLHPADFFYDNLMMAVQLIHESYLRGIEKFVALGTICAYPKFTRCPLMKRTSGMAILKRQTLLRAGEKDASGTVTGLPSAVWL